jgi:hypothetical protein
LSQSLADLFATVPEKKKPPKQIPKPDPNDDTPLAYPAAESLSDVIPPDDGKVKDELK